MKIYQKLITSLLFLAAVPFTFGQGETWRWNFGNQAALFFPGGGAPVAVLTSVMNTFEGCASIGTPAGNLAFYTNGNSVWNANNVVMPNGFGLFGNASTTQAAIIVPRPGSPNLYYVFCSSSNFSAGTLSYSEVDMNLLAGLGNVTAVKNVVIQNNIAEKLTAVRHCNGVDVWVIIHDYTNSDYKAFLVTAAGVNPVPVVSAAGAPCSGNVVGVIKTSPNGKKIAYCASNSPFALHVADFDNATGIVSNAINLAGNAALVPMYGLEFSPDSRILYGSRWAGSNQVWQWDLCGTPAQVVASALMVGTAGNTHGQMQLGPDGKIYVARAGANFLGVIDNPNTLGVGCNYIANGVNLGAGKSSQYGLPTFIQSYLSQPPPPFTSTMSCLTGSFAAPNPTALVQGCTNSTINPVQSILWNFGDPASGPTNTSNIANPIHVFSAPGTYTVKLVLGYACSADTITGTVTAVSCGPSVLITGGSICPGECAVLTATPSGGTGPYTYAWTPNIGVGPGPFTVCPSATTIYSVTITDANNQTSMDTALVFINPPPTITVTHPTVCLNSTFTLSAIGGTAYAWSGPNAFNSNQQDPILTNAQLNMGGNYSVVVTSALGCTDVAVASVNVVNLPVINIALSTPTLCMNNFNGSPNTVVINASGANSYTWTGFTDLLASTLSGPVLTATAVPPAMIGTGTVVGSVSTCTAEANFSVIMVPNPAISVPSASVCFGQSVMLSATGADSFSWSPATTLNSATGSTVLASPTSSIVYSVIGNSVGCNSPTETTTVTVQPTPVVSILGPPTVTICEGGTAFLQAMGADSYSWNPPIHLDNPFAASVASSPLQTTMYSVVGSVNSCTASAVVQVSIVTLPDLSASASASVICEGDLVNINANGASSYTWFPYNSISNPYSNFITANPSSSTTYTLVGNNGICSSSIQVPIVVVARPTVNLLASPTKVCYGSKANIFASGAQNYNWSPIDSNLTVLSNNMVMVQPKTSTNYTVIGYNSGGNIHCSMTQEILVEVVPPIVPEISPKASLCKGESVRLNAGGSDSYRWVPEDGLSNPQSATPVANPNITTIYTVHISNGGFCGVTTTVMVEVKPTPTVDAGPDMTVNIDDAIHLSAKGNGTLTWIMGDGVLCQSCPDTQIKPQNSGCYIVKAVNQYGCSATDEVCIELTKDFSIYIPNTFTPNEDGVNDTFKVYGIGISEISITIFDRWGERMFFEKEQINGWDGKFKGDLCKNDVYVYKVTYKGLDGKKHTKTGHVTLLK